MLDPVVRVVVSLDRRFGGCFSLVVVCCLVRWVME